MDALIKVSAAEFNEDLFNKIKSLIRSVGNAEITIAVSEVSKRTESEREYWDRLNSAITDIEQGKGITFTMEGLTEYLQKDSGK